MIQTAIWIPPSLCGCQLRITGDFIDGSVINGVSYKHPAQYTISNIDIVSVCDEHQPQTLEMPDTSVFFDTPDEIITLPDGTNFAPTLKSFLTQKYPDIALPRTQKRGYLQYPITDPTPAHNLYTHFWHYCGQTHGLPCGCHAHQFINGRTSDAKHIYLDHPRHTHKCHFHHNDTVDMQNAKADFEELAKQTGWLAIPTVIDTVNQDSVKDAP